MRFHTPSADPGARSAGATSPESGNGGGGAALDQEQGSSWTRPWYVAAAVVVALGVGLRLWRWAADWPLWLDEQMISVNLRDMSYAELPGELTLNQSAPLGWLWAQRLMIDLFGTGEQVLRFLPLVFGLATLALGWWAGRRWLGPAGTVLLLALLAFGPQLVRYSAEVKQYSWDVCVSLLLLAVAAWTVDRAETSPEMAARPQLVWWSIAAGASFFSNAGILMTPPLALVILVTVWRTRGLAAAVRSGLIGLLWLAVFVVQYLATLKWAAGSDFLKEYWSAAGSPPSTGPVDYVRWFLQRPFSLARDPGGAPTRLTPVVVGLVAAGVVLAFRRRQAYGWLLVAPMALAAVLSAAHVVPLTGRLALWLLPVMLVAVAISGAAAAAGVRKLATRKAGPRLIAAACAVVLLGAAAVVATTARQSFVDTARTPGVDDRAAIAWLREQYRPGDLTLIVGSGQRALLWYDPDGRLTPNKLVYSATCPPERLPRSLAGLRSQTRNYKRVLAYSGIRVDQFREAYRWLEPRLSEIGTVVAARQFGGGTSLAYVVELSQQEPTATPAPGDCLIIAN